MQSRSKVLLRVLPLPLALSRNEVSVKRSMSLKPASILVAFVVATATSASMAFGLGPITDRLEIGKPFSIRIPLRSISGGFDISCVTLAKAQYDKAGDNFPVGMSVSIIAGEQSALLLSGPSVKQPIVAFTVISNCPNANYERTYQLLPDLSVFDEATTAPEKPKAPPLAEEVKAASLPVVQAQARPDLQPPVDQSIDTHKRMHPRKPALNRGAQEAKQDLGKIRQDVDAIAASLDRLSGVVQGQMDMQIKSMHQPLMAPVTGVKHGENIAAMSNTLTNMNKTMERHDEAFSWRRVGFLYLISTLTGAVMGLCFAVAGFLYFDRRLRKH